MTFTCLQLGTLSYLGLCNIVLTEGSADSEHTSASAMSVLGPYCPQVSL